MKPVFLFDIPEKMVAEKSLIFKALTHTHSLESLGIVIQIVIIFCLSKYKTEEREKNYGCV